MAKVLEKQTRDGDSRLKVIIVGAGLGGLGAAIAILLAGHDVLVLESAPEITEIGAGIQCLPNSSRIMTTWGMLPLLEPYSTKPRYCNMIGWKGNLITRMDFHEHAQKYGYPFWDFHRANLHRCLLDRAISLGAELRCNSRVTDVQCEEEEEEEEGNGIGRGTVILSNGLTETADLVVGADGISSKMREIMRGIPDPPTPTGDLAYRLLLNTEKMLQDPELADMVLNPQVNYWLGPDAHAVTYVLRGGKLFNMVLLVPDDMPADAWTLSGNIKEMRSLYEGWDPRIGKLLLLCDSVFKWKLCIRHRMSPWSHPSGAFTLLGDAAHATLPYLASGAGMSFEDGAVLGECLGRIQSRSRQEIKHALRVYEACRGGRTDRVMQRGNKQQYLYHLHDGPEQRERDRIMQLEPPPPGEALAWRDSGLAPWLLGYNHIEDVDLHWDNPVDIDDMTLTEAKL